jgi:glycosyltransferase involved in cell wall biosynthesis
MRILLSIPSLAAGGAERQFAAVASGLAARGHEVLAVALGQGGPLAADLGAARLIELGKTSRLDNARVALALARLLRREAPQVHYAFLPTCCVLGALLKPFCPATRLVFGSRATKVEGLGQAGRLLLGLEARLAHRADLVIANSKAGQAFCLRRSFPAKRVRVVDNGIDTMRFCPDWGLGAALRAHWGVEPGERLVGLAARLDPLKDHATFLEAAARLAARQPELRFVCVGGGPAAYAQSLRERATGLGLAKRLIWAGEHAEMPAVYNALDVACLSSVSEGLPNVLCEAMSCGVPCVTTDVGDAARVVEGVGLVVPPRDPAALADGLAAMLERLERDGPRLAVLCRERVEQEFSLARMVEATEALLRAILPAGGRQKRC